MWSEFTLVILGCLVLFAIVEQPYTVLYVVSLQSIGWDQVGSLCQFTQTPSLNYIMQTILSYFTLLSVFVSNVQLCPSYCHAVIATTLLAILGSPDVIETYSRLAMIKDRMTSLALTSS